MPLFLLGLLLGSLSGLVTYGLTDETQLALIAAAIAAVLTWLGLAAFLALDD
ncbi:hypothetical protein RB625_19670 [Streptomyces californicus]|uniref:hypothetical protein n=1 Tax=Streptomyces californicus TaxID=67351 RepID=UPI00296F978F|nr:hypothetical protein [Streptomyces californicus]MDW4900631.1 hypothetical protein [Streptomyces californicus]